jgi:hypothetical protein
MHKHQITAGETRATTLDGPDFTSESTTYHNEDQKWDNFVVTAGLRYGDYTEDRWFFDVGIIRMTTFKVNGLKTTLEFSDLWNNRGIRHTPTGLYVQYMEQSGWYVRGCYIEKSLTTDWKNKYLYNGSKAYWELSIGRSIEWFGKAYSKKKR